MISNSRLKIIRGQDSQFIFKLRSKTDRDPLDLTTATKISVKMVKSDRSELVLTNEMLTATKAKTNLQNVNFIAADTGVNGNLIQLNFDGVRTIQQIVSEWNTANPTNTVEHDGIASAVLTGGVYTLKGGMPAYMAISVVGSPVLGKISVKLIDYNTNQLRLGTNQNVTVLIDFGVHPTGTRIIAQQKNFLDVVEPIS